MVVWSWHDSYFIAKGPISNPLFLTKFGKWTKNIMKAIDFDEQQLAEDYLQSSSLRSGRVIYLELTGKIIDGRYETDTNLKVL